MDRHLTRLPYCRKGERGREKRGEERERQLHIAIPRARTHARTYARREREGGDRGGRGRRDGGEKERSQLHIEIPFYIQSIYKK